MKKLVAFLGLAVLLTPLVAQGAEFIQPGMSKQVIISSTETHNNLYTAGRNVTIGGKTNGDLVVAGGNLNLTGPVSGELMAAGGSIYSAGSVAGHVRIAGGYLTLTSSYGGDLLVAGGNVNLTDSASVKGDLVAAGGNLELMAPVEGNAKIVGKTVLVNSKISGALDVTVSQSLSFGPKAEVAGPIVYRGVKPATVDTAAKVGAIQFTQLPTRYHSARRAGGLFGFGLIVQLLALIIVGFLALRFRRTVVQQSFDYLRSKPWPALGWGVVGAIVIPIVVILLFITLIGYYAALILLFSFILMLLVASVIGSLFVGRLVLGWFNKTAMSFPDWQIVVLGVILWEVLKLIPVVGWMVLLIVCLMSIGSLLVMMKNRLQQQ